MKRIFYILALLGTFACTAGETVESAVPSPSNVRAQKLENESRIFLEWNCSGSVDGFYIHLEGSAKPVSDVPSGTLEFTSGELEAGAAYRFGVQAHSGGRVSTVAWAQAVTVPEPEPEKEPEADPSEVITFNWKRVSVDGLSESIGLYETTDKLEGKAFHAWYAVADCSPSSGIELKVLFPGDQNPMTIDAQAQANAKCQVLINGGIFSSKFLRPIGFALYDGVQTPWRISEDDDQIRLDREYWSADGKLHPVSRALFGVDRNGKPGVFWSFTPQHGTVYVYDQPIPSTAGEAPCRAGSTTYPCAPADWVPYNALTCGPVLLKDWKCPISAEKTANGYWKTNYELWADDIFGVTQHPDRTAVGYTVDGKVILFICDGRISSSDGATTLQMAKIMRGLHCKGAINLDGGGSTGMWVKGRHINDLTGGNRAVMTTVGFFTR